MEKERLLRDIDALRTRVPVEPRAPPVWERLQFNRRTDEGALDFFDPNSPLSRELQLCPWLVGFWPRLPSYDGRSNPAQFLTNYEATIWSASGDSKTMAKSFVAAVTGVAYEWYNSLKPMSISSWGQLKSELVSAFQGYQAKSKTMRDLLSCKQGDNEPMTEFLERFVRAKAQVPNAPEEVIIAAAISGH